MKDGRISDYLSKLEKVKGFFYEGAVPRVDRFEENYIQVREKEGRIYSELEIKSLPFLKDHPLAKEWKLRHKSTNRVCKYFEDRKGKVLIDIGCGNGWFSHLLSNNTELEVIGLDINTSELEQAAKVFPGDKLKFLYGDIFSLNIPKESVDYFTMNASIQYFPNPDKLLERLVFLLKPRGEIHIIDSPFYSASELVGAKQRTLNYFTNLGFPAMAKFYHHHTWGQLADWDYDVLYQPSGMNRLKKALNRPDSPFPWIRICKL